VTDSTRPDHRQPVESSSKFHAANMSRIANHRPLRRLLLLGLLLAATAGQAEKGDRAKPMTIEADQPGTVDLQRQVVVFSGNVVITQGTMVIRADRIELRERPDGYRAASAIGSAARPATFRQKRDGVDEVIEGVAERIDYDGRTDMLTLAGQAAVRRLRAGTVADEVLGSQITWDNTRELFTVVGGAATAANPGGRVRAVFTPPAASAAPGTAASAAAGTAPSLKPSPALGGGR
jgi:lipopolysaccharide export system protein LptA